MGGVTADGRVLWLSGRYNGEVYAISTTTGRVLHRIPVGAGPHGLCVWPQPWRYSIGHTGSSADDGGRLLHRPKAYGRPTPAPA